MTYTVIGVCPESARLGVGITTYSIGVGGYCPFFERGVAALSTQAFANPALGPLALAALRDTADPERALDQLAKADPGFEWRQVVIATHDGRVAAHTGPHTRPWSGHVTGEGFRRIWQCPRRRVDGAGDGRCMVGARGRRPPRAAARRAPKRDGTPEARRTRTGSTSAERSSALIVRGADIVEDLDLRVDLHDDAVGELRRLYERYRVYLPYYALRARSPAETPPQDVWARENDPGAA